MKYQYMKNTPWFMIIAFVLLAIFSIIPLLNLIILASENLTIGFSKKNLSELGQFGDFFGGHTAAFTGSISLVIITFFTFHQSKQQEVFFRSQSLDTKKMSDRQFFIDGLNLITQWDISSPGCDQCMRLLDHYGKLALTSEDKELLLLLNTVITAQIRKNLEGKNGSFRKTNYPYACDAIEKISGLRKQESIEYKNSKKLNSTKMKDPSTPQLPEG
jgi:hypothetical protein